MTVPPVGQPIETINQMIQMARQYILDAPDAEDGAEMQAILDNLKELIADVDDAADNSEDQSPADAMPATAASSPSENRSRPRAGQVETRSSDTLDVADKRIRGLVPYGVESRDMGGWREVIDNTAFRNTDFSELRAVIDHRGTPLARYPRTLELEDRSDGLAWSIDPPQSRQDVIEAVQRGDMNSGSWRMKVSKDRWEGEVRHVQAISHLYDVTLVGAELPAYPSAAVEYRSQPAPGQEEPIMADQAEHRSGGLDVESVEVIHAKRDLFEELAVASRETHPGEIRSLTTAVSLATPEYSTQFFDVLRPTSAFLRSGVRTISTSNEAVIFPYLTADSTIGWCQRGRHDHGIRPDARGRNSNATQARVPRRIQQRAGRPTHRPHSRPSCAKRSSHAQASRSTSPPTRAAARHPHRQAWATSAASGTSAPRRRIPRSHGQDRRSRSSNPGTRHDHTCTSAARQPRQGHPADQGRHGIRPVPLPGRQRSAPIALRR